MTEEVETHDLSDGEVNAKLRELTATMEKQYKLNLINAVERSMDKNSAWRNADHSNNGCSGSCSFFLVMLIGSTVAACVSWIFNHSVLWCILHAVLGWLYVCYKAFWYVATTY